MASEKSLKVTQVRSVIGAPKEQKATVRALGLKHVNDTAVHEDTPAIRGMLLKVKHLVDVEEL